MSENALTQIDQSATKLLASTRSSRSFQALRAGTASERLYSDWLAQTALYTQITREVLEAAAHTLSASRIGELVESAPELSSHGKEEGEENLVIMEDLSVLGVDLTQAEPIPPITTYCAMLRSVASDPDWAIGMCGVARTLELLAADCARITADNLRQSSSSKIRNALKFLEAHQDEEAHLARTVRVVESVPAEFDHTIAWCAQMACLLYEGLLCHLDARDYSDD